MPADSRPSCSILVIVDGRLLLLLLLTGRHFGHLALGERLELGVLLLDVGLHLGPCCFKPGDHGLLLLVLNSKEVVLLQLALGPLLLVFLLLDR